MFDMEIIGKKIANARKEKDMTQMELAEMLNISFQAVSNWERGLSMPDISKLPELSELLGLSIDELLGSQSPLLNNIAVKKEDEYLNGHSVSATELLSAAPLLKPSQVDEIFECNNNRYDISEIEEIVPFLSKKLCEALFVKYRENDNIGIIDSLAPFVGIKLIDETLIARINAGKAVGDLAIFASIEVKEKLVSELYEKSGIKALDEFLPFISGEALNEIAEMEYRRNGLRNFEHIAPFMNKTRLNELARAAIGKDGIKAISPIAPFIDKDILSELVKEKYL